MTPGDLIVADPAGIVLVPRGIAVELLGRLEAHKETNAVYLANVQKGEFSNAWVDTQLETAGCPVDERTVEEELRMLTSNRDRG